jgi:hypothetical protein
MLWEERKRSIKKSGRERVPAPPQNHWPARRARKETTVQDRTPRYTPSVPVPGCGYVRTFEAEIDYLADATMRVRGVQTDHRHSLEYAWIVRLPNYEIVNTTAHHRFGEPEILSPTLLSRCAAIQGACTTQGFTTAVREALGPLPGSQEHLGMAVEMARVSLQGFPVPKGDHERFASAAAPVPPGPSQTARMAWERDRAGSPWICNSCYAYRDESAALFEVRQVQCFDLDLISPTPGQRRFFWRTKQLQITTSPDGLGYSCHNAMNDTFHELDVTLNLAVDGTIRAATSQSRRLAFTGMCEDTQKRTPGLVGKKLDKRYARLLADHVGGRSGCSHLFDLSVDCLRFFQWRE